MSRAPYGARGLKSYRKETRAYQQKRRAPYGARGLKFPNLRPLQLPVPSRPVWGAWIEIDRWCYRYLWPSGRAPYGARGLKLNPTLPLNRSLSRAPYGARGLKFCLSDRGRAAIASRPVWGAWIEIVDWLTKITLFNVAPRMGRVD